MDTSQTQTTDPAASTTGSQTDGGAKQAQGSDTLAFLSKTLNREFKDLDDATKSLENLKSMVGDQAIAQLREKAQDADHFNKLVSAYAKEQGVDTRDARRDILAELSSGETTQTKVEPRADDGVREELRKLQLKFEEKELLEAHPEAKTVLDSVRDLARASGKSLSEAYEKGLKDVVSKASAYEKEKGTSSTTAASNSRQGTAPELDRTLIDRVKSGRASDVDKNELVSKFLGLK